MKWDNLPFLLRLRFLHPFLLSDKKETKGEQTALWLKMGGLAGIYFLLAKFGLSLAVTTEQVTAIGPATGVALASLLIFGYRLWPGILIGAFAANAVTNEPILTAVGIAASNTATALFGAYLLKEKLGFRNSLGRIRDVVALAVGGAFISPLISSVLGVVNLAVSKIILWPDIVEVWLTWWMGDVAGLLIFTPLVLVLANKEYLAYIRSRSLEAGLFFASLVLVVSVIFLRPTTGLAAPYAYLVLPFIVWAAFRLKSIGAATANFVIAWLGVWGTVVGRGPFQSNGSVETNLMLLLVYLFVFAVTCLLMAVIIEERQQIIKKNYHQFYHDSLTGLPNRFYFFEEANFVLKQAGASSAAYALLKIDLDRFKTLNDSLGYEAGDRLMKLAAKRIKNALTANTFFARSESDEFLVFLPETKNGEQAITSATMILESLKKPFALDEHEVYITASIGISSFPSDGSDASGLLASAKTAVQQAKDLGRNNYQFYSASLRTTTFHQLSLENALRTALQNQELEVHFEPQIDLASGRIVKNEALMRWNHPTLGLLPASEFIELAEITGMIDEIGDFVLEQAIARTAAWQKQGLSVGIAVNLSSRQFHHRNLAEKVGLLLKQSGLSAKHLELEVTERALLTSANTVLQTMKDLKKIGIAFSIDDFNTGYSSMTYIQHFPIDVIKIDKEFVKGIPQNSQDCAIAKSIIDLAHSLRKIVVAEGVETKDQLGFLKKHRCHLVQGYLFSKPIKAEECLSLMKSQPNYKFQDNK
ncbi:MAG: EAL domain-containing protein [Candidatus Doudnabacteria bacterium]|nr:EAL domain-containing protein [Candidatus Doudnabacteria bacterium]